MYGGLTDEQVHRWLQEIADLSFISLHFASPALGGNDLAEIFGGGYTRFPMTWHQPVNRGIWSSADAVFSGLTPNRVTYFGVWSDQNLGFLRGYGELPSPATIASGKGYVLAKGEIAISLG
jgi:hypothetical protein